MRRSTSAHSEFSPVSFVDAVAQLVRCHELLQADHDRLAVLNGKLRQELQRSVSSSVTNSVRGPEILQNESELELPTRVEGARSSLDRVNVSHTDETLHGTRGHTEELHDVDAGHREAGNSESHLLSTDEEEEELKDLLRPGSQTKYLLSTSKSSLGSRSSELGNVHLLAELKSRDLKNMFRHICTNLDEDWSLSSSNTKKSRKNISPHALAMLSHKHTVRFSGSDDYGKESVQNTITERAEKITTVLAKVQRALRPSSKTSLTARGMNFGMFKDLVTMDDDAFQVFLDESEMETVHEIRGCLIRESVTGFISEATRVDRHQLFEYFGETDVGCLGILEYVISVVIILNAIGMGISTDVDPDWDGWFKIESVFTFIFCVELVLKISICANEAGSCRLGVIRHFTGSDGWLNVFDALLVTFSVIDFILTVSADDSGLSSFSIARLTRLSRLARLSRVLRLKVFKNILLLLNGAVGGLHILCWSVILMFFVVYCFGLLLRQTIGQYFEEKGDCFSSSTCSSFSEEVIVNEAHELFGTVARSMWTVFRCVNGDCASKHGSPVPVHLANIFGYLFVLPYVLCVVLVVFGLFNLIMAVFVENTLEYAKYDDTRRRELHKTEHLITAKRLEALMMRFVAEVEHANPESLCCTGGDAEESEGLTWRKMNMHVSLETFERVVANKEVQQLFNDLDIPLNSRRKLFETLDADSNGLLSIRELAHGIMKLRGPTDKTDIISVLLVVQGIQQVTFRLDRQLKRLQDSFNMRVYNSFRQEVQEEPRDHTISEI